MIALAAKKKLANCTFYNVSAYPQAQNMRRTHEAGDLGVGRRNTPNESVIKDPSLLTDGAKSWADLPDGHSEGYDDTFKQIFRRFYRRVADAQAAIEYPTFEDGLRQLQVLDRVLESSQKRAWLPVPSGKE
jgi:hypothetical protein